MAINKYGIDEYESLRAGSWFYTQRKFGSEWFNNVDNRKGWTVDFNLTVETVEDNDRPSDVGVIDGAGILINDGRFYENIKFLLELNNIVV